MARRKPRGEGDLRRRAAKRESYDRVLIVCEGEKTEPNYFCELRAHYALSTANVDVVPADGSSPITVVRSAIRRQKQERKQGEKFDRVYCIFDKDEHGNYYDACRIANNNRLTIASSIPCFEYWLLLHCEYTRAPFSPSGSRTVAEQVLAKLKTHLPDYEKSSSGLFARLLDNLETAKTRAARGLQDAERTGEDNPSTHVHELVEYLQTLKEKTE